MGNYQNYFEMLLIDLHNDGHIIFSGVALFVERSCWRNLMISYLSQVI